MKKTNALKLRQSLGAVLDELNKSGMPILVEKGSKPAAVLISVSDYEKRFVDQEADVKRIEIIERIKAEPVKLPKGEESIHWIRQLRGTD